MLWLCLGVAAGAQAQSRAAERLVLPPVRGLDEFVPAPDDNPLTLAKIALGRRLFFDPVLSRDRRIACVSCHVPAFAFGDTLQFSRGAFGRMGRRNAPAIVNRAWGASFFWDGRSSSLEEQVLHPIQDSLEMDLRLDDMLQRLTADSAYTAAFRATFPDGTTTTGVAHALATYVRAIRSGDAPVDRFRSGDTTALSPAARRGLQLFGSKARCHLCHVGPNFTDEQFHNTGVSAGSGDPGRFAVTNVEADRGAFKTPTLRDVARTAPYMHDGHLRTLEAVVDFYDGGGRRTSGLDRDIRPLALAPQEKADLVAFLRALSSAAVTCAPLTCQAGPLR